MSERLQSETIAAGAALATQAMIESLRQLIRRGNARWKRLVILQALGITVAAPLAYLWLVFWMDNILHLPTWGRTLSLLLFFAGVAALIARLALQWRQLHFTEDQVALAIERHTPGRLENRLINSIQLARQSSTAETAVSDAVVQENYLHLQRIHLQQAARAAPALIQAGLAALLIIVGLLFWFLQRERFANAATRIFLPFARVTPMYRTQLTVEPGDVVAKPGDDVTIRVRIAGQIPPKLAVLKNIKDERTSEELAVPPGTNRVAYTFKAVNQSIVYAVRGGDFISPYYTIEIPAASELKLLTALFHYPAYTRLPDRKQESAGGDLEALFGTRASLRFALTQPAAAATLVREAVLPGTNAAAPAAAAATGTVAAVAARELLKQVGPAEFEGALVFRDLTGYRLETQQAGHPPTLSKKYEVRVIADQAPELQLAGIDERTEALTDALLPVTLIARDDFGLTGVGLFARRDGSRAAGGEAGRTDSNAWQTLETWTLPERTTAFTTNYTLPIAALDAVEGEAFELALGGKDNDPLKGDAWTIGQSCELLIGGSGAALQVLYEQILRSEAELRALIQTQESAIARAQEWNGKFDAASGLRWDDQKTLDAFASEMRDQAKAQSQVRQQAAEIARRMAEKAGNLRLSVGMLADTEMVRAVRILENAPARDTPQNKRAALADARLTQERTVRSLREILEQYVAFRKDWELYNMIPFTKMLAERQQRMSGESQTYAGLAAGANDVRLKAGTARRQTKMLELVGLDQAALAGMSLRAEAVEAAMTDAFARAAAAFDGTGLKTQMQTAIGHLQAGRWGEAGTNQQTAATALAAIHQQLLKAQADAARRALADLQTLAESNAELQKELARLKAGSGEQLLEGDFAGLDLAEITRMRKLAEEARKKQKAIEDKLLETKYSEDMQNMLGGNKPTNTDFSILKLGSTPSGGITSPDMSDRPGNKMKVEPISEKFQDLVGDLLEEADELRDQYETFNIHKAGQGVESGNIGKQAGDMNAVNAAAATGNMKPPTVNVGGASRAGRHGARAHGMVVGDEAINRRGRDESQEGQEQMPDQAGKIREVKSDDPQRDISTGIGGKEVISQDETSFSVKDAGEWKDEVADKMKAPQSKNLIVERKGKPLDPRIGEKLRDLESTQEQVIERVKTIKKELDNLYLPTDDLDESMKQMNANLDRLKENPDAEVVRSQLETIDKLKGAVVVFNRASSDFQPSVAREQAVRGQIPDLLT
jgi:hypothetical protein